MAPKLSIAIPTYNRTPKVVSLLTALEKMIPSEIQDQIEIVISDNHSAIPIAVKTNGRFTLHVVSPEKHLFTAEENLAFLLRNLNGEFVWVLGDDDLPLVDGFLNMWSLINSSPRDLFIFNSTTNFEENKNTDVTRVRLLQPEYETDVLTFASRAGLWSVMSGFSTLVFKRESIDIDFLDSLHERNLFIYSHAIAILKSFSNLSFCFIRQPLVFYSMNNYDKESISEKDKNPHWTGYALKVGKPFRDPWTLSFLSQIQILAKIQNLELNSFANYQDLGDAGNRFFLFDAVVSMFVDQIIIQMQPTNLKIYDDQDLGKILLLLEEIYGKSPKVQAELNKIANAMESKSVDTLEVIRTNFSNPVQQLVYRSSREIPVGIVYETAFGSIWSHKEIDIDKNLGTIDHPLGVLCSNSRELLEVEVRNFLSSPNYVILNRLESLNVEGLNVNIDRIHMIFSRVPGWLRRWIRLR